MKKLIFKCQELVEGVDTRAGNLLEKINPKQIKKVKTRTTNMNYGYKAKNIKKKTWGWGLSFQQIKEAE